MGRLFAPPNPCSKNALTQMAPICLHPSDDRLRSMVGRIRSGRQSQPVSRLYEEVGHVLIAQRLRDEVAGITILRGACHRRSKCPGELRTPSIV